MSVKRYFLTNTDEFRDYLIWKKNYQDSKAITQPENVQNFTKDKYFQNQENSGNIRCPFHPNLNCSDIGGQNNNNNNITSNQMSQFNPRRPGQRTFLVAQNGS